MTAPPVDEAARRFAREEIEGSLVIEAGAGTGKTRLLIDRLLKLLQRFDLPELVAITFTEKAAGELADRLRRELEMTKEGPSALPAHRRLRALADFDRANISTIHAFAASLIRLHPVEAGVDPDFEHIEQEDERQLLDDLLAEEFSRPDHSRDSELADLVEAGGKLGKLRDLALALAEYSDILPADFGAAPTETVEMAASRLMQQANGLLKSAEIGCLDHCDKGYQQIVGVVRQEPLFAPELPRPLLLAWLRAASKLKEDLGSKPNWRPGALDRFKAGVIALKGSAGGALTDHRAALLGRLLERMAGIVQRIEEAKRSRGQLGYQDLLVYARRLMDDPALRAELQTRYQKLLIDEFQDTDPLQVEMLLLLAGMPLPGDDSRAATPTGRISVVGDPKQSIYRFRRADARLFSSASEQIRRAGAGVELVQNFRSAAGIIEFVNAFFAPLWPEFGGAQAGYSPLHSLPDRPSPPPNPPVAMLEPPEGLFSKEANADRMRRCEAEAVARTIADMVGGREWKVLTQPPLAPPSIEGGEIERPPIEGGEGQCPSMERGEWGERSVEWGDVAVLLATRTGLDLYAEELTRLGVPFQIEGGKAAFARQLATDLLNCLKAVDNPADRLAVVGAVRSGVLGASDPEIALWGRLSGLSFDYLSPPDKLPEHLAAALGVLRELHIARGSLTPNRLIERLLSATDARAAIWAQPDGAVDADVLDRVLGLARRWGVEQGTGLRGFRRRLERLIGEKSDPTGGAATATHSRVQVMTIHAAKGLEFPVVFIANLGSPRREQPVAIIDRLRRRLDFRLKGDEEKLEFLTPGYEASLGEEKLEEQAERLRLLYVAMTRARDHLIISRINSPRKNNDFGQWLAEYAAAEGAFAGRANRLYRTISFPEPAEALMAATRPATTPIPVAEILARRDRLVRLREDAHRAALSRLPLVIRPSRHEVAAESSPPHLPRLWGEQKGVTTSVSRAADSEAMALGRAVHRYIAACDPDAGLTLSLLERICRDEAVSLDRALAHVERCLASESWRRAIASSRYWREAPVTVMTASGLLRGALDLIWEDENGLQIADFKTGEKEIERHRKQLADYAGAVMAATGREVAAGWIFYSAEAESVRISLP